MLILKLKSKSDLCKGWVIRGGEWWFYNISFDELFFNFYFLFITGRYRDALPKLYILGNLLQMVSILRNMRHPSDNWQGCLFSCSCLGITVCVPLTHLAPKKKGLNLVFMLICRGPLYLSIELISVKVVIFTLFYYKVSRFWCAPELLHMLLSPFLITLNLFFDFSLILAY